MSASRAAALAAFKSSSKDDSASQPPSLESRHQRTPSQLGRVRPSSAISADHLAPPLSRPVLHRIKTDDGQSQDSTQRSHTPIGTASARLPQTASPHLTLAPIVPTNMAHSASRDRPAAAPSSKPAIPDPSDQESALRFAALAAVASRDLQELVKRQGQSTHPSNTPSSPTNVEIRPPSSALIRSTKPSADNTNGHTARKPLISNSPKEVVKNLQDSLKSKTITSSQSALELSQKNQQMLVDLRQSIENKRRQGIQPASTPASKQAFKPPVQDQLESPYTMSPHSVRNRSSTSLLSNRRPSGDQMARSVSQTSRRTSGLDIASGYTASPQIHSPVSYTRSPASASAVTPASVPPALDLSRRADATGETDEFYDAQSDLDLGLGQPSKNWQLTNLSANSKLQEAIENGKKNWQSLNVSAISKLPDKIKDQVTLQQSELPLGQTSYYKEGASSLTPPHRESTPAPIPIPKSTQACSRDLAPSIMDEHVPALASRPTKSAASVSADDHLKKLKRRPPPESSDSSINEDTEALRHSLESLPLSPPHHILEGYASLTVASSQDDLSAISLYAGGDDDGDGSGLAIDRDSIADSEREAQETDPNSPYFDLDYDLEKPGRDLDTANTSGANPESTTFLEDDHSDYMPIPGSQNSESTTRTSLDALALLPKHGISSMNPINKPVRLKTTMRDTKTHIKKSKKAFNEDKPWKNHLELAYLSDPERKRYEGIWVSNKGLYMDRVATKLFGIDNDTACAKAPLEDPQLRAARLSAMPAKSKDSDKPQSPSACDLSELMLGIVVKRLWTRSRLPTGTLETIWSLVDFRKDGTLDKPGFLVGMWLVDQCLYGRKLPKKVEDIVWEKLGGIGVNVVVRKGRR